MTPWIGGAPLPVVAYDREAMQARIRATLKARRRLAGPPPAVDPIRPLVITWPCDRCDTDHGGHPVTVTCE